MMPKPLTIDWNKQPLGKVHDAALAAALGVSRTSVVNARARRRIAPCGCSHISDRLPAEFGKALGTAPDKELAARFGVSQKTVINARWRAGIPSHRSTRTRAWDDRPLGLAMDKELAAAYGVTVACVTNERRRRGIPSASAVMVPLPDEALRLLMRLLDAVAAGRDARLMPSYKAYGLLRRAATMAFERRKLNDETGGIDD